MNPLRRLSAVDPEILLTKPSEARGVEYKQWLDLDDNDHRALLAKALIALANFGGGRVVLGFKSVGHGALTPCDEEAPGDHAVTYAPERIQRVIGRYASYHFEVTCEYVERPGGAAIHPVITVPPDVPEVVFPKRGSSDPSTLLKGRLYTRLPGPRSATPETPGDWTEFIEGLVKRRSDGIIGLLNPAHVTPAGDDAPSAGTEREQTPRKRTVRDRMSDVAPPAAAALPGVTRTELLEPEEVYVLENPVSEARVTSLQGGIRDDLESSMPILRLFEVSGTRTHLRAYEEDLTFGLTHVSFKGPLVEHSSWVEVPEREFALAIDEFLRNQFAELLGARSEEAPTLAREIEEIGGFVVDSKARIQEQGGNADLVVLLEPEGVDVDRLFMYEAGWWDGPLMIRDTDLQGITYLHGHLGELPVLQIHGAPVDRTLIAIVDLGDYELTLANVDGDKDDYLDLQVTALTAEEAHDWVLKAPEVRESLFKSKHHREGAYSTEEAALRLQLMARYRLQAAGEVRERHRPRTISVWLDRSPAEDAD